MSQWLTGRCPISNPFLDLGHGMLCQTAIPVTMLTPWQANWMVLCISKLEKYYNQDT
jgi:hypothetical protein